MKSLKTEAGRLKVGTILRNKTTGELFKVVSRTKHYSKDRFTEYTLTDFKISDLRPKGKDYMLTPQDWSWPNNIIVSSKVILKFYQYEAAINILYAD